MKYIILTTILLIVVIVLLACKARKKTTDLPHELTKGVSIISFSKESCRGTCKVFTLNIHKDKTAHFQGIENVALMGDFEATLDESQYQQLLSYFKGFETLRADYTLKVRDLQKVEITYQGKTIQFHKRNAPASLVMMMTKLDELVEKMDWAKS